MTPIIYPWGLQAAQVPTWLTLVNPITPIVLAIQRALYGIVEAPPGGIGVQGQSGVVLQLPPESPLWYFRNLVIVAVVATILLGLAFKLFARLEGNFAEEL
jgi:ABC-type polysaccharide/polyol phosphate export permease